MHIEAEVLLSVHEPSILAFPGTASSSLRNQKGPTVSSQQLSNKAEKTDSLSVSWALSARRIPYFVILFMVFCICFCCEEKVPSSHEAGGFLIPTGSDNSFCCRKKGANICDNFEVIFKQKDR